MDRISELSDDLLVKILLFVPTKVAVSTSILSKRWEYLWMWLPKLEYGHRHCSESEANRLQCFLDRNLPLHRAPVIQSLHLELRGSRFKPENINMWILNAVSHCVRELDISYYSDRAKSNIFPSNLFTCKSLVILKLDGRILLDVPTMVDLPSLKTLKLKRVKYFKDGTLQRLLSNCPVLEDLVVHLPGEESMGKLTVVVPSLQRFSLYIPYDQEIEGYVIETTAVKYFRLEDYYDNSHYCLIENMPNLIVAHVVVELDDVSSLIGSITSVKRLTLCSEAINDVSFVFDQLEHLEVCPCTMLFSNKLVLLLKASSNLQGLDISFMNGHESRYIFYWNEPSTVPECILSSLQSLSWSMYRGEPQERDIVVYILKHALHLKTATIKSYGWEVPRSEMLKELALSFRASTKCQLMFE